MPGNLRVALPRRPDFEIRMRDSGAPYFFFQASQLGATVFDALWRSGSFVIKMRQNVAQMGRRLELALVQ